MSTYLLGIDQGTSSSRAIIFDKDARPLKIAYREYHQWFPQDAWIEQNPDDIWQTTLTTCQQVLQELSLTAHDIIAIGITNQRETTLLWDKKTGEPIYNAIAWQDARTADACQTLIDQGLNERIREKTGLLLNPYFSATKIKWLLDNVDTARERAERGELLFGTVDTFLLWRLTGGASHKTDATNASRTLLFNIHTQQWDDELLELFTIPRAILPQVLDCSAEFGNTLPELFGGEIAITGMVGDQQGALFGQACFREGMAKATFGTGAFVMCNTGEKVCVSENKLLSTVAYRLNGVTTYAIEGSIFVAGAGVKWLRDNLNLIHSADETEALAKQANADSQIYFVPSFTGLGAPYWDPNARASISGLTLETGIAELVRALLEGCAFSAKDVIDAIQLDTDVSLNELHVDGGMAANNWLLQFLADILAIKIKRPAVIETTVLGAVYLAGLQVGIFKSLEHISELWQADRIFGPDMKEADRQRRYQDWQEAVQKVLK